MFEEATLLLLRRLGWRNPERLPRVATLACVLSHVREDAEKLFGAAIGRESIDDKDSAVVSVIRFQRLLDAESEGEIERGFRRAVAMLSGQANVADLARIVLFFDHEETRRRLAFDYYAAGAAAPRAAEPGTAENV
jgi:CRISPR system Cascade subunit CasB